MVWKQLEKNGLTYEVSEYGDVRRLKPNGEYYYLKKTIAKDGYVHCGIGSAHTIVAKAFLNHQSCGHKLVVSHKDNNKQNNHFSNLEVVSHRKNILNKNLNTSSIYDYVYLDYDTGRWRVTIKYDGKQRYCGSYSDEETAGKVSDFLQGLLFND